MGSTLQERLIARRQDPNHKSWLYEWWNDVAYLSCRAPVVPYVSYFYFYRDNRRQCSPVKRAAAICTATLEFQKQVDGVLLEPELMKKNADVYGQLPMDVQHLQSARCTGLSSQIFPCREQIHPCYPQESIFQGYARS